MDVKNTRSLKKERNNGTSKLITSAVIIASVFFVIFGLSCNPDINKNNETIAELRQELKYEKQRAEAVDALASKVGTDDYYEAVARDKLGMIRKDEIIFKEIGGDNQ